MYLMINSVKFFLKYSILPFFLFLAGCEPNHMDGERVAPGIVYCSEGDPTTFNPQLTTTGTTTDATSYQLYNRLVEYDPALGSIMPGLAHHWHINENGKIYTFYLRKEVPFHSNKIFTPTRHFNADDVLFSFNRIIDSQHPYNQVSGGTYPFFQSVGFSSLIEKIVKVHPHMITIHLKEKDSSFLANLAANFAVILSKEYGDQLLASQTPAKIDTMPIGTGPFYLDSYFQSNHIRYKPNKSYWGGAPTIEQLVFDITPKSTNRIAKLLTGDCDVSALPQSSELEILRRNLNLELQIQTGFNVSYFAFNLKKPPFDQPKVRQAIAHAINKRAIIEAVYYGSATEADSILPPLSWAYNDELTQYKYNPELSKQLLAEVGLGQGFEMDIWTSPVQRIYNPNAIKTAELLQGQLANIGVKVNIISYGWSVFLGKLNSYEYDSVLLGWTADNADPDNFFRPIFSCAALASGSNRTNWCSQELDQLFTKAISSTNQKDRTAVYHEVLEKLNVQLPLIPIAHALRFQVKNRSITGMPLNPYGGNAFAKSRRSASAGSRIGAQ